MVFENLTTMVQSINIFEQGTFLLIIVMTFVIARAFTRSEGEILQWMILIGSFGAVIFFKETPFITSGFLVIAVLIIIYGFKYLKREG